MVRLQKNREELLKTGKNYINKDKKCNELFRLYRQKLRLSEDEALVKVAQIVGAGASVQALRQLKTEKVLNPVTSGNSYAPSEPLPDWMKKLNKSLREKLMRRPQPLLIRAK
ncbi:MAG: hypothetical protein HYW05_00710 [Candidatus Diapherotrites archaeon]|nr:hypothetical protein [Candidatus Diapherotrites archaeon]